MRYVTALSFPLVFSLTSALAQVPASVTELSPDDVTKLEKGEVVVKGDMYTKADGKRSGKGKAYCVINKPADAPWATLWDYGKVPEYLPRVERVVIINKTDSTMKVRQEIGVAFTSVRYTLDFKFDNDIRRMDWKLDKTQKADIADTFGSWEFFPYGAGRTLVRYTIALDTGQYVPEFVESYLVKKDLPEVLLALKRRTESDGAWKK
jgi:carbon monoxide dehydrogenase subunit G